jgi:hypothetical protein
MCWVNHLHPIDLTSLPTPLAAMLDVLFREDAGTQPFRAVHRLVDSIEVFAKLHTVAGVCAFADALTRTDTHPEESVQLRVMLAAGLRTPSLGTWWQFARESARALRALGVHHPLPGADVAILERELKQAFDGHGNLITFRNGYAHGATPSDEVCRADLQRELPRFLALLEKAHWLREREWILRDPSGTCWLARGLVPTRLSEDVFSTWGGGLPPPATPPETHPTLYLRAHDGLLALDPLLVHADGHAWFYNDLRERHATLLDYPRATHRKESAARAQLLARFPLDQWRRLGGHEFDPFRERVEALTDVFRGRSDEIASLVAGLRKPRGFHVVWGPPGVGKSALLARVVQLCRWEPALRAGAAPAVDWTALPLPYLVCDDLLPAEADTAGGLAGGGSPPPHELPVVVHVVEFFIRRGTNATAGQLFDSLNQRIDALFGTRHPLGSTDVERRAHFDARLRDASAKLRDRAGRGRDERLLIVIDGLDEAAGTEDPLLSLLPRHTLPHVRLIYGARPTQYLRHAFYDELDREHRTEMELGGLGRADTRALLAAHVDKYGLEEPWLDTVWTRSEGNPLYLRLLCQGVQDGAYRLGDALGLPNDMATLYGNALVAIERRTPGASRLLALLAAAHDFMSPAMAAELLGCDVTTLVAGPLGACRELLYENPLTAHVEDYQLFHESLREYLKATVADDVRAWEEDLADWCVEWRLPGGDLRHPRGERRTYAMRHAVGHLSESARRAHADDRPAHARTREDSLLALVDDHAWRATCFEACGEPGPLRQGFTAAQRILRARERSPGGAAQDLLRLARWYHDEPARLYEAQRKLLQTPVDGTTQEHHLQRVAEWAGMGARPREKVMLALTAVWATPQRPRGLPRALREQVRDWLEEAREPALDKLWTLGGGA